MRPTVSTLNIQTILEENVQSEILLSRVIDVNTCILENEIFSGLDTSHGIPAVDTTSPECALSGLTSTNNSSKERKSPDGFPTSIKNVRPAIHYLVCRTGTPEQARRTGRPDSVCWQKLTSRAAIRPPDPV